MKRWIICIWIFSLVFPVWAQRQNFKFDNYSTRQGLSDHYITAVFQDSYDWVWVGTGSGIERFDGMVFKRYPLVVSDTLQVNDYLVRDFFQLHQDTLLVGVEDLGLFYYNLYWDRFEPYTTGNKPLVSGGSVKRIARDSALNLWLAGKDGVLKMDARTGEEARLRHLPGHTNSLSDNYVRALAVDAQNRIWIGTKSGLDCYNPGSGNVQRIHDTYSAVKDDILDVYIDKQQRLWVGTSTNGLLYRDSTGNFRRLTQLDAYERSAKVNCIRQDAAGVLWLGTRGGMFAYTPQTGHLQHFFNDPLNAKSLAHNSVVKIFHDNKGDVWVATRAGLSYLSQRKTAFRNYFARQNNTGFLNNAEIYAIWEDDEQQLWLGTESGGINIINRKSGLVRYLTSENTALSNNCIKCIAPIGSQKIIIGALNGGVHIYHRKTGEIQPYQHREGDVHSLSNNTIWDVFTDQTGRVWIGTGNGLDEYLLEEDRFVRHPALDGMVNGVNWVGGDHENDLWVGSETTRVYRPGTGVIREFKEKTRSFFEDSKGRNWLMTSDKGIALYDKYEGAVRYYGKEAGFPSNLTYCMLEDADGVLWVSTANGLVAFHPETENVMTYYEYDGIQGNQFHYGAAFQSPGGQMYFGGMEGLTTFFPEAVHKQEADPRIYLTDFKVFTQSVPISNKKNATLKRAIGFADEVNVAYKNNVISFSFAALNYTNSPTLTYQYMLEGFDAHWRTADASRSATYTNLNPGMYTFKVRSGNRLHHWNTQTAVIGLHVIPPLYLRTWFLGTLTVLLLTLATLVFYAILKRREREKALEFERVKIQKLHELDTFKLKLFTNISHEIKTPLTLIISPLKRILQQNIPDNLLRENLQLMNKNAKELMQLVTQLLDYRKLEEGELKPRLKRGDVVLFCKNLVEALTHYYEEKAITVEFLSVQQKLNCYFDDDKLKNILNNLLTNAIRYNKQGGTVRFSLSTSLVKQQSYIRIEVADTGVGIPEKFRAHVFQRFFSHTHTDDYTSSGIGLAYAKELIELQNGTIHFSSKEGEGTTFTVLLPLIEAMEPEKPAASEKALSNADYVQSAAFKNAQKSKQVLLVIDDNADIRNFIGSNLQHHSIVLSAETGKEGLELAIQVLPDVIISDVMMPNMNGLELCEHLKKDERTSHIPVILLTALSSEESRKDGLLAGADDYITKPFDLEVLQVKLDNLMESRRRLKEKYSKKLVLTRTEQEPPQSPDELFLDKVMHFIEENLEDPTLNIDSFTHALNISKMQLYRKVGALTNMTVKELLNDVRLQKAAELLPQPAYNVSEVAFKVGFNDLSYFGKCFKKKYQVAPSKFKG